MKQPALVIIKPDGMQKQLVGNVLTKFAQTGLEIVAIRVVKITRTIAEEHYKHLSRKPFFDELVDYFSGRYHNVNKLIAMIYYGNNAIKKCRDTAGATNPEDAAPESIRGSYGRITTGGIFENVVHVSSDAKEARREITLWFKPDDVSACLYPVKTTTEKSHKKRIWA